MKNHSIETPVIPPVQNEQVVVYRVGKIDFAGKVFMEALVKEALINRVLKTCLVSLASEVK
ncbi:MAG: hypothetical protein LBC93_04725 [Synergistaceae bacterium]|jgi:hypothetical protein|nr:hypothetical protein [Synergistaceae bacterium]